MGYVVLARKWRPKKFEDVVGQEHIVASLKHALATQHIGHAYLFAGTRGIGKTSMARLFAKSLRCEQRLADMNPCGECPSCLDSDDNSSLNIIEIDGASNNKVEDVRELIENVRFLPTSGKYKIYIIDEVHMLSTSAFNALLKTLEEPPAHVVFLLATTEPKKLLGTVLSRCQRFDFRNASLRSLEAHVTKISTAEGIKFESKELISQVCKAGQGSIRDTLSLLDQVVSLSAGQVINADLTALALGTTNQKVVDHLLAEIFKGQFQNVLSTIDEVFALNISAESLGNSLMERLFEVIQSLDTNQENISSELISASAELGAQELIWMYETLAKDISFILELSFASRALSVSLIKLAKRREFFEGTQPVSEKKKTESVTQATIPVPQPIIESAPIEVELVEESFSFADIDLDQVAEFQASVEEVQIEELTEENISKEKTFLGFMNYLKVKNLAMVSNLEQGNLITPLEYNSHSLSLHLGYAPKSELFYDHLSDADTRKTLLKILAEFFEVPEKSINLNIELIGEDKGTQPFTSMADVKQKEKELHDEKRRKSLIENPLIKEAESLFNTKVDKIILNEEK